MSLRALVYAYVLGGLTLIPLLIVAVCFYAVYTSVPVGGPNVDKLVKGRLERESQLEEQEKEKQDGTASPATSTYDANDLPKPRKGWLTVRRTFEKTASDGSYVGLVRGFLDARSKDPKRSRPKDMWYVVLKRKVLYLYEDENMKDCEAAIELGGHDVVIYPEGLMDGELFAKRNAICLKPKLPSSTNDMPSVSKEMMSVPDYTDKVLEKGGSGKQKQKDKERAVELEKRQEDARQEALDVSTPWFIFVKSNVEMEDWYHSLVHASDHPPNSSTLAPLQPVFQPTDMLHLVETLDEQPDVIPMRWLNALIGRLFFSFYRTQHLESYIIGRLMRKLSKIKRPAFLTDISVREVSVGNKAPTFSKPMLKELTKEGDASLEVHLDYKGEFRITVDATATINLGAFKSYTVKLVLAAVLREMEGNLLIKVKRPPSNRIWYAFTQMPRMVLDVEPVVSDRQITWGMILSTIEARLKEVIQESVVMPNMDDIAFFESSAFSHRGGIWADASRHERSPDLYPSTEENLEETQSTMSAPILERAPSLLAQTEPPNMERSQSAPVEPHSEDDVAKNVPNSAPLHCAQTMSGSSASSSSSSAKRRTWFNSQREDDGPSMSRRGSEDNSETVERGRSGKPSETLARRPSTTSSVAIDEPSSDMPPPSINQNEQEGITSSRPTSQHSRSSSSPSQDDGTTMASDQTSTSAPTESLFAGFRSKSPGTSSHPRVQQPSPTANFFQTLKSRDKQAIGNTAKEAMRKWGVSWGGLKKEANSEDAPESDPQKYAEPQAHKPRASSNYAEVRAAVAQRRGVNLDTLLSTGFVSSDPVAIPQTPPKNERPSSVSPNNQNGFAIVSSGSYPSPSTSPPPNKPTSDSVTQPRSVSPALSAHPIPIRQRTASHVSGNEAVLGSSAILEEDEQPVQPIRTQPSAPKAMVIPGIHASHRGEVMSMGYAPPTPPPAEQKKPAAAIQSVYRLWKGPTDQQSQSSDFPESQTQTQAGFTGQDQDASASSTPPTASSSQTAASRPVPPPLPPRTIPMNAVKVTSEPPRHRPESVKTSSPASAALQSIVSRDNSKRSSLEPLPSPPGSRSPPTVNAEMDTPVMTDDQSNTNEADLPTVDVTVSPDVPHKPKPPALPPRRPPAAQAPA